VSIVQSMMSASLKVWMWAKTRIALVSSHDVASHPVPDAAKARKDMFSMIARSQQETHCLSGHVYNRAEEQPVAPLALFVKQEINHISAPVVAPNWQKFVKGEAGRSELDFDRDVAHLPADVVVEYGVLVNKSFISGLHHAESIFAL